MQFQDLAAAAQLAKDISDAGDVKVSIVVEPHGLTVSTSVSRGPQTNSMEQTMPWPSLEQVPADVLTYIIRDLAGKMKDYNDRPVAH